jgi:threonylcarbamoyladenosine tRNA methylthiotransferase MtaB
MEIVRAAVSLCRQGQKNVRPTVDVPPLEGAGFEDMSICRFARTRAYIKIEDGCESHCTYCIIPSARGHIRSKPMQAVLDEVRALTEGGCREVVLTGIETASWGRDLDGANLADLLEQVDRIPHIGRVRLGSLDPTLMRPAFVERIARLPSLAPHFHLSMQSGSDAVLARMKRKYNRTQALAAMERLREAIPDVMLTTDIIVGFPGETEQDFEATMDLARRARFLMIHVFPYSKRKGTPAAVMADQVPTEIKKQRVAALSALSADIRREILSELIEKQTVLPVLFETYSKGTAVGHTPNFIEVHLPSPVPLHAQTHNVRLLALTEDGCGCIGEIV